MRRRRGRLDPVRRGLRRGEDPQAPVQRPVPVQEGRGDGGGPHQRALLHQRPGHEAAEDAAVGGRKQQFARKPARVPAGHRAQPGGAPGRGLLGGRCSAPSGGPRRSSAAEQQRVQSEQDVERVGEQVGAGVREPGQAVGAGGGREEEHDGKDHQRGGGHRARRTDIERGGKAVRTGRGQHGGPGVVGQRRERDHVRENGSRSSGN